MHIIIVSYYFDKDAEGLCTGRLVRAILKSGLRVTVITSENCADKLFHDNLQIHKIPTGIIRPRVMFNKYAEMTGSIPSPHFLWSRKVSKIRGLDEPTLIYGRAQPLSSNVAAVLLGQSLGVPVCLHFSDPMPSPWDLPETANWRKVISIVQQLVRRAAMLTFTTEAAIRYVEKTLDIDIGSKSVVLPHISPSYPISAISRKSHQTDRFIFSYIGSFYRHRQPDALLKGFKNFVEICPYAKLRLIGTITNQISKAVSDYSLANSVELIPPSDNIDEEIYISDVLVAVDSFIGEPVFMSTKFIEYLNTTKVIFLLSPENSPSSLLVSEGAKSIVLCSTENPKDICAGLKRAFDRSFYKNINADRSDICLAFNEKNIVNKFIDKLKSKTNIRI